MGPWNNTLSARVLEDTASDKAFLDNMLKFVATKKRDGTEGTPEITRLSPSKFRACSSTARPSSSRSDSSSGRKSHFSGKAEMVQEMQRIEQAVEQHVSEHHLQIHSRMSRVAERTMGAQRPRKITEATQALQMRDESTAQQLRACDELNEHLHNQVTSLRQQTVAGLQTQHQQTSKLRNEFTRVTEEVARLRESVPSALMGADARKRVGIRDK